MSIDFENKLVVSNNVDYLKTLPDNSIDFVVTSPPYDNLRDYKGFSLDLDGLGEELYRVMKDGGVCVWVVQDACVKGARTGTSLRTAVKFMDIGWRLWDTLSYFRRGVWAHEKRFRTDFEYMFVFLKGNKPQYFNKEHLDVPNPSAGKVTSCGGSRKKDGTMSKGKKLIGKPTKCRGTIFNYNFGGDGTKLKKQHPAVFPDILALDMVECFCPPGGIVLDPFNGSGTTVVAAKSSGRKYLGIDISEEYVRIAEERLEKETIVRPGAKLPDFVTEQGDLMKFFNDCDE